MKTSKVPWVDLQAPGWISFIPTREFAKTMTEPTKIMDFWRDKMKVVSKFAGFGDKGRPRMERFLYDSAAQGGTTLLKSNLQVSIGKKISSCNCKFVFLF